MSSEFLLTLSGSDVSSGITAARAVLLAFRSRGFNHVTYTDDVEFDPADNTFAATDRFGSNDSMRPAARLQWKLVSTFGEGLQTTLVSPWLKISLMMGKTDSVLNCFIQIPFRRFQEEAQRETIHNIFALYAAVAEAMNASGGLGGVDRDEIFLPPESIVGNVLNDPQNSGFPAVLGIFSKSLLSEDELTSLSDDRFTILDLGKYWLFEEKDFVDAYLK